MIGQKVFFFMRNHGVISILPLYENIRLYKHKQEIIETCLQVLNFKVVGPNVRKNKHSPILFIKIIILCFLVKLFFFLL